VAFLCVSRTLFRMSLVMVVHRILCSVREKKHKKIMDVLAETQTGNRKDASQQRYRRTNSIGYQSHDYNYSDVRTER